MKNSFGNLFRVTTFGESHGGALGAVIDGCPSGVDFDFNLLTKNMERRRPGNFSGPSGDIVSQRKESDQPDVLSGVFKGKTLGTPIAIMVKNKDARSKDYDKISKNPRVGHADDTWIAKFGHVDPRGGGRSSGRETVARVMAGSVAEMCIKSIAPDLKIFAFTNQIGTIKVESLDTNSIDKHKIDRYVARMPCSKASEEAKALLIEAKKIGKSYGGVLKLVIKNPPMGLGQPVFNKLKAELASAFLGVGATTAFKLGHADLAAEQEGTEFHKKDTQAYGGIRGGISTGKDIHIEVTFKPTSTVLHEAKKGRHDPCIIPRAVPVIESMAFLVVLEHLLWKRLDKI